MTCFARNRVRLPFRTWCLAALGILQFSVGGSSLADSVDFNRDVRPILSENCYFCHGPDENTREAGLRLDERDEAIDFGAIVEGKPNKSELVARIKHQDPNWVMPPPESHKTLTETEKKLLERWIQEGAEYQKHWSFTPIRRPEVTAPQAENGAAHPVDQFVLRRLLSTGAAASSPSKVTLSPLTKPHQLVRRLYLDLIGLPPTWDQVTRFEADFQENPSETIQATIEELFQSPHHGERMAMGWLDLVRYADTVGFHGDQNQNIFPYRDWVIESFQSNQPFDQFTRQQLAGDLLPDPSTDDLVASGFNRLNMMTREGGAQPAEYLAKYAADRVRTIGMTWLGLTTGCAECHDHKFDPFTARDFYSLAAFFSDLQQWGVYSDYGYTPNADLKGFNNNYPFPPEIEVTSNALLRRQSEARKRLIGWAADLVAKRPVEAERWWELNQAWLSSNPSGWRPVPSKLKVVEKQEDTKSKPKPTWRLTATDSAFGTGIRSFRIRIKPGASRNPMNATVRLFRIDQDGKRHALAVKRSDANRRLPDFNSTQIVPDVTSRWRIPATNESGEAVRQQRLQYLLDDSSSRSEPMMAVFQLASTLDLSDGSLVEMEIEGVSDVYIGFDASPFARLRPLDTSEVETLRAANDIADETAAITYVLSSSFELSEANAIQNDVAAYREARDGQTFTMVSQAINPRPTRVLPRGNWQDGSGELVTPAIPEFLQDTDAISEATAKTSDRRLTRLDLANWLVSPDNPLTARVVVNRLWKQFFGQGLSASVDDLGAQGEVPSHPDLLNYLATELIDSGWDLRHVMRLILTSRTYQQDSRSRNEYAESDPNNRLLTYHPPRRLEAELVRDNALAISGLINLSVGGPSTKPYQPPGYYANLQFPNRQYTATSGKDQYRRGIYMHWQRTFLHPMLANFDAPSREDCVAIRAQANTPQQALTLLNDPTFAEAAGHFAWRLLTETPYQQMAPPERARAMVRMALQREATSDEVERLVGFQQQSQERFTKQPDQAEQLATVGQSVSNYDFSKRLGDSGRITWASWAATCRVLLNLHETITRY